ncbi:MAG: hypothetical protein ACKVLA_16450 [Rhodobacterales bacterium]
MTIATLAAEFEVLMFEIIIAALDAEGRIPMNAPWTGLNARLNHDTLVGFMTEHPAHADARQHVLMTLIAQTWNAPGLRHRAERKRSHPVDGQRRRSHGQLVSFL